MPAGPRVRTNNVFGITTDNPLTAGATSFNSAGLANLAVVASAHAIITLDPLRQFGAPEIIVVTVHTAAATVATITRGAYGTTARSHPQGTTWVHAPVTEDVISIVTSGTRPSDPYRGESIFETDTNRYVGRSTADVWQQHGLFFDPPACRLTNSGSQTGFTNGAEAAFTWDTETYDTDSMHSTAALTDRITFNTAGIYSISFQFRFPVDAGGDYTLSYGFMRDNAGVDYGVIGMGTWTNTAVGPLLTGTAIARFTAGQWIQVRGAQFNASAGTNNPGSANAYFTACWIGRGN